MLILQKENNEFIDVDVYGLHEVLKKQVYQHEFTFMDLEAMERDDLSSLGNVVPVGTLSFVGAWLRRARGVEHMNPIEVPDVLRVDRFIGRRYAILMGADVPRTGYVFCKDAGRLKGFSNIGPIELLHDSGVIIADQPYVVSEVMPIDAEYRVIVLDDKIEAIQFYDGYPTVFPDAEAIQNIVTAYQVDRRRPRAYALDVAVVAGKGTFIIENHAAVSFGTYGYTSSNLPYLYRYGLDYYLNVNKPISLFTSVGKRK